MRLGTAFSPATLTIVMLDTRSRRATSGSVPGPAFPRRRRTAPTGEPIAKCISYHVILNDGETYSSLEGCTIVGISSKNRVANEVGREVA